MLNSNRTRINGILYLIDQRIIHSYDPGVGVNMERHGWSSGLQTEDNGVTASTVSVHFGDEGTNRIRRRNVPVSVHVG